MTTKDEKAASASKAEMLTPVAWAERKGLIGMLDPVRPWEPPYKKPGYAAAEALHGWLQDAHDFQGEHQELKISEADFEAAIVAGGKYPAMPAHGPACGRLFKDRAQPAVDPRTKRTIEAVKSNG
jgi:hypothetical protein